MSLGKNVRKLREARGWEQKDLAAASGVSNGTISAIEVRDSRRSAVAPALARALGVTLEQLMSDDMDTHAAAQPSAAPAHLLAPGGPTLEQALEVLSASLNELPDERRELAAQHLQTLARAPDSKKALEALLSTMVPSQKIAAVETAAFAGKPKDNGLTIKPNVTAGDFVKR